MPVYKQINSSTDAPPLAAAAVPSGDISVQLSCTCPISDEALVQNSDPNRIGPAETDSTLDAQIQSADRQHQQEQQPQKQHLSTCALHSKSIAILKQQQQAKRKRQLELQQEERARKRYPFEPLRVASTRTFHLYAGSQFRGKQRSGSHSYDVKVDIKHVDLNDSFLCGYLHINGLTEEYPELTTYFEAEIIGPKHTFQTRKWDADELIDEEHWTLFKPFECLASSVFYGLDEHDLDDEDDEGSRCPHHHHYDPQTYDHRNEDVVFMRWKEHFLVPDHHVRGISGASFAGFYYICYSKTTGQISGYYYHQSSEKFQQLLLNHVEERSFGSFEFR